MNDSASPHEDVRFYGRRRGRRLRAGQQRLLDERLPALRLDLPAGDAPVEPAGLFAAPVRDIWLEIGFGGGEHLVWQAQQNPDIGLIGAEPYINGVARLLSHMEETGTANIRILPDDVRPLLARLAPNSLGRAFILFPDPWPKARHQARRIVNDEVLDHLARALRPGAELRLASDDADYLAWMLRVMRAREDFAWLARRPGDWRERPADWPATRYEEKNRSGGFGPVFLRFRRENRDFPPSS